MDEFSAKRQALLAAGVRMMDPSTVYVEESVTVGPGTLLLPGTILRGKTAVGAGCEIGPNTMLVDLVDTFCAGLELAGIYHPARLREQLGVTPLLEEEPALAPC